MSKVKLGKLERKEKYESNKQQLRDERDTKLKKLDKKKDSLNKHQQNVYDDSDARKVIRAEKRAYMQELRDKERGQRRADRKGQRIDRIMNRNNMTKEEASQEYDRRRETLDSYSKGPRENLTTQQLSETYNPSKKNLPKDDETNKEKVDNNVADNASQQLVDKALIPTQSGYTKRNFLEDYQ